MLQRFTVEADLTLVDGAFHRGLVVSVEGDRITGVGVARGRWHLRLSGRALLPGLVNAHSHAFQRAFRGRVQRVQAAAPSADFWSWRTLMYEVAGSLTPEEVEAVSRFAYVEMLLAGYTSVAEFHYLHHAPGGVAYDDPLELSRRIIAAAGRAGIRLGLLPVAYERAGHGKALEPAQRRFVWQSPQAYLRHIEQLAAEVHEGCWSVGLCLHSVRAVSRPWLEEVARASAVWGLPLHIHAAEQPAEIEQCEAEHGRRPIELLSDTGVLSSRATVVHGVHLSQTEVGMLGGARATVCACPTTERDLGDGVVPARALLDAGVTLALGSDSHAHIDGFEEMRALEGHERLARLARCVLKEAPTGASTLGVASTLFAAATRGGARAIAQPTGEIAPGRLADLISLDLTVPALAGWSESTLLDCLVFSGRPSAVRDVFVAGQRVVVDGHHPGLAEAQAGFEAVIQRLWG